MDWLYYFILSILLFSSLYSILWAFAKTNRFPNLLKILPYMALIFPLILALPILSYLSNNYILIIFALVFIGLGYYLYVFLPSYQISSNDLEESFDNPPIGTYVSSNNNFVNTNKNTFYAQASTPTQTSLETNNFQGQAGPCLIDNRFGYQLGFGNHSQCQSKNGLPASVPQDGQNNNQTPPTEKCPTNPHTTNCKPVSGTDFEKECQNIHQIGMKELDDCSCPTGQTRGVCEKGYSHGLAFTDRDNATSCLRMDLPPFPNKLDGDHECLGIPNNCDLKTDGNPDFWCRQHMNTRKASHKKITHGVAAGCYDDNKPNPNASRLQCYSNSQPSSVNTETTDCYDWSIIKGFGKSFCKSSDKYVNITTGNCPPTQGRVICKT